MEADQVASSLRREKRDPTAEMTNLVARADALRDAAATLTRRAAEIEEVRAQMHNEVCGGLAKQLNLELQL